MLIDREALLEKFQDRELFNVTEKHLSLIQNAPLIDAVEVCRCCDCKYSVVPYKDSEGNVAHLYCHNPNLDEDALSPKVDFTDFCSYGRRESEGT